MFCPLCRAEFRPGFIECSDCHVPLVPTLSEAATASVQLWKGSDEEELNRILAALDAQEILSHFNERVRGGAGLIVVGIPLSMLSEISVSESKSMSEYEVWVFREDLERAKVAIVPPPDGDGED
jgi:hypothetical protein